MNYKTTVMGTMLAVLAACGGGAVAASVDSSFTDQPWPAFYQRAGEKFAAGERDEAVTLFYVGQLRGRIVAQCMPVAPDQDPALLASLNSTLGQQINEYAGGSPAGWAKAIDEALAFDAEHPDPNAAGARCRQEREDQREGLAQLRTHILANVDRIRRDRVANGLPNR